MDDLEARPNLNEVSLRMGNDLLCWDCNKPFEEKDTMLVPAGPAVITSGQLRVCLGCASERLGRSDG